MHPIEKSEKSRGLETEIAGPADPARQDRQMAPHQPRKTPRERFVKLAPKRTQAVIDKLKLLARCGNRVTYRYEGHEIDQIFKALDDELQRTKAQFQRKDAREFQLR